MPDYTLPLLDVEISFKTEADEKRISEARDLVEKQYNRLQQGKSNLSKEKLLAVLALSLADDYLQGNRKLRKLEEQLGRLLAKIE